MDVAERNKVGTVVGGGDCEDKIIKRSPSKNSNRAMGYLTPKARLAFTKLRKAIIEAPIFRYFNLECHIRIETNALGYAIRKVLS